MAGNSLLSRRHINEGIMVLGRAFGSVAGIAPPYWVIVGHVARNLSLSRRHINEGIMVLWYWVIVGYVARNLSLSRRHIICITQQVAPIKKAAQIPNTQLEAQPTSRHGREPNSLIQPKA
jgi:hypothetical protein